MPDETVDESLPLANLPQMTQRQALRRVAESIAQNIPSAGVGIILANANMPYELRCEAIYGAVGSFIEGWTIFPSSFSGQVYQNNQAARIDGATLMKHHEQGLTVPDLIDKAVSSCIAAPIRVDDLVIGIVFCFRLEDTLPYTDKDLTQLQTLIDDVALSIADLRQHGTRSQQEHLMNIMSTLPVGILWTDGFGQVIYVNEMQSNILGYSLGELLNGNSIKSYSRWHHPDSHELYQSHELPIPRTIVEKQGCEIVLSEGLYENHTDKATLVKTHALYDEDGHITDIIAILTDVTAQCRLQYETQRQAVHMHTLLDNLADGVTLYDRHGTPIRMSKAALAMLGWDEDENHVLSFNQEIDAILEPQDLSGRPFSLNDVIINKVLAGEAVRDIEVSLRQPDGTRILASMSAAPLRDVDSGEITGAINLIRNVTHWQQLDHMKDEFISIASHELRTPLTSLLLATNVMQRRLDKGGDTANVLHLTHDIIRQAKTINHLIDNMLALTRITGDSFTVHPQECDFAEIVRKTVREQEEQSHRPILVNGIASPIYGFADAERIEQVISNLIGNALRFSPDIINVTVTTEMPPVAKIPEVTITVQDHGKGIPLLEIPQLFEWRHQPDVNADEDVWTGDSGLHIGLFISQAIIEHHGGTIAVESEIGKGTKITVTLPITKEPLADSLYIHPDTDSVGPVYY